MQHRLPEGECYKQAAEYILGFLRPEEGETLPELSENAVLVQGTPILRVEPFGEYGHAWVEDGETCFDPTSIPVTVMPKKVYYLLGSIDPERNPDHREYTADEVSELLIDTQVYGPWLDTSQLETQTKITS